MRVLAKLLLATSPSRRSRWWFLAACLCIATPAVADDALTLLTIDGRQLHVAEVEQPRLRRIARAEGGFNVAVDDYAVVWRSGQRLRVSFATEAFRVDNDQLTAAARLLRAGSSEWVSGYSHPSSASGAAGNAAQAESALLIRHPYVHPAGHNYTPTPEMDFSPQVIGDEFEGHGGFAIVSIGETGRVKQVTLLDSTGPLRALPLRAAIASGITTQFQDERRHDHTVYFAYQVRRGVLRNVGPGLVTFPMCCVPGPGEPCGQVHCEEN